MIRPLDLLFFRGEDVVSETIIKIESLIDKMKVPLFSHVGVVVGKSILNIPELKDGVLYVMESTCSFSYPKGGHPVPDIYGRRKLGVQIRPLDDVVKNYVGTIYHGSLMHDPMVRDILPFWEKFRNGMYDGNPISLLATIIPCLRPIDREVVVVENTIFSGEKPFVFCSELVAYLLIDIGLIPSSIDPAIVTPIDLLGARDMFPPIVSHLTPLHQTLS